MNFYVEEHPGEPLKEILIFGKEIPKEFIEGLGKDAGVPVEVVDDNFIRSFPSFYGAALISPRSTSFNFIPREVKEQKLASQVGVLVLFVAFSIGGYHLIQYLSLVRDIKAANEFNKGLQAMITLKEKELASYAQEMVKYYLEEVQPPWYAALMELSAVVPDGISFVGLKIRREHNLWRGEALAKTTYESEIASLLEREELIRRARRSPLLKNVSLMESGNGEGASLLFSFTLSSTGELLR
jgi:hypothetical protein